MALGEFCSNKEEKSFGGESNNLGCKFGEVRDFSSKKKKTWSLRKKEIS